MGLISLLGCGKVASAGAAVSSITFGSSATSAVASVTVPAGVVAGDIIVLAQMSQSNAAPPASAVPSGFTSIADVNNAANRRLIWSYKKAVGTEASTSITGMNGDAFNQNILLYFHPNTPATTLTVGSNNSIATASDPAAQTIAASGHTPPLIALGFYAAQGAAITTRTFTVAGSDAKDGEIPEGSGDPLYLAYKVYNSSPANITVDMIDVSFNYLLTCDIQVA